LNWCSLSQPAEVSGEAAQGNDHAAEDDGEGDAFEDMDDMSLEEALGELADSEELATLGIPARRQAFKAVVNLIEAFEELQRTVPVSKRDSPCYLEYQQRIFEVCNGIVDYKPDHTLNIQSNLRVSNHHGHLLIHVHPITVIFACYIRRLKL
jgi:hypothetical protein